MNNAVNRRRLLGKEIYEQTAYGNPILVRSMARMRPPLTVYGHSTQDGTPSPENPVPIVSAGDGGEINVTVQGGNLFDKSTITPNKYVNDIDGEVPDDISGRWSASDYINVAGMSFIFATMMESGNWMAFYDSEKTYISGNTGIGYGVPITVPENARYARFTVAKNSLDTFMVNAGSTALPYEPYKQPQTLTIPTPGGLSGIPVSSGGNYTDESGQQWVCDEIDYKRGKYVQRVGKEILNGNNNWVKNSTIGTDGSSCYYFSQLSNSEIKLITHFRKGAAYISQCSAGEYVLSDSALYLMSNIPTLDEFKSWINEEDVTEYYALATPIETDLTAEEIAAYKALHTYSPTSTVSNDAGAWMKLGYKTKKSLQLV